ncbi:MAG: glucodextranase DOMON-like domain-containing protein [Elusimicrobiota bacterium]
MKNIQKFIFFSLVFLSTFSYGSVVYLTDEEELKNIFTIGVSTSTQDILVIPPMLLKNLSDENKDTVKKLHTEKKYIFAGTTYTDVILPVLFNAKLDEDVREQIENGRKVYYEVFEEEASVFYPHLGIISEDIIKILIQSGYSVFVTSFGVRKDLRNETDIIPADLSRWTGSPVQNLAWDYIKQAKLKLTEYTDSISYDAEKYDAAKEELYNLEKPIWFENYISSDENKKKENDLWFRAGLSNVYRAIGQELPPALSVPLSISPHRNPLFDTTTGEYILYFADDTDDVFLSSCNLLAFGVKKSTGEIVFDIFISSASDEVIDIYIDLNKKNNAGSTSFIGGHNGFTDSLSAWEYAISVSTNSAKFFRYSRTGPPVRAGLFTVNNLLDNNLIEVKIPEKYILGNPKKWGYIVAGFLPSGDIFDIIGYDVPMSETIIQVPALRSE